MTQFSSLYDRLLTQELGSEDSTRLFTTARRQAAVNDGIQEFADLTECFVKVSSMTWDGGTYAVNLHSSAVIASQDFVRFPSQQGPTLTYTDSNGLATVLGGDDLQETSPRWLDRHEPGWQASTVSTGTLQLPSQWYLEMDGGMLLLGFYPKPTRASTGAAFTLRIPYVAKPPVLTADTDEPYTASSAVRLDLRPYHRAAVAYAASQLEKLRRDSAASQSQLQAFLSWVTRYLQKARRKGGQSISFRRRYFRPAETTEDPRT